MVNGSSPYAYNAHFTPSGALCHLNAAWGNTFTHFWTYNNRLQPVQIQLYGTGFGSSPSPCTASTDGAGYNVFLTYSFVDANGHNNGNVTSVVNTMDYNMGGTTVNYTYDSLNRLASAQTTGINQPQYQGDTDYLTECWAEQYSYDPWGNLLSIAPNGSSSYTGCMQESGFDYTNFTNTKNQITYTGFSYDAAGNLTTPPGAGTVTYDAENRIVTAGGVNYTYDGDGKRVIKNPGKIFWYNTQGEMIVETDLSGNALFRHYYFYGVHVSRYEVQRGFVDHYGLDHLGNTRFLYNDSSGSPGWDTSDFYPFGGERVYDSTSNNQFKFTGKERDSESGLDNFGARYDSSSFGRFLSPDPLLNSGRPWAPQTWNRYAYALNNPLKFIDPTGLYNLVNNCDSNDEKCNKQFNQNAEKLKKGLENLKKKLDKVKDPDQRAQLRASLLSFGTENDGNNVNVSFGATKGGGAGETDPQYDSQTGKLSFNVTLDPSKIANSDSYAVDAAHEGTHISDISDPRYGSLATTLSPFQLEYRGYQTSAAAVEALGYDSISFSNGGKTYEIWNRSWYLVDDAVLTRFLTSFKNQKGDQTHPETVPHNPWAVF